MLAGGPVLVLEDDPDVREGLTEFLQDHGFEVLAASDGESGLEQLRSRPDVSVVLLDLMMPSMDGRMFRKAQLGDPRIAAIPVIVVSAIPDPRSVAEELGATHWLRKPFNWDRLVEVLETYR